MLSQNMQIQLTIVRSLNSCVGGEMMNYNRGENVLWKFEYDKAAQWQSRNCLGKGLLLKSEKMGDSYSEKENSQVTQSSGVSSAVVEVISTSHD